MDGGILWVTRYVLLLLFFLLFEKYFNMLSLGYPHKVMCNVYFVLSVGPSLLEYILDSPLLLWCDYLLNIVNTFWYDHNLMYIVYCKHNNLILIALHVRPFENVNNVLELCFYLKKYFLAWGYIFSDI